MANPLCEEKISINNMYGLGFRIFLSAFLVINIVTIITGQSIISNLRVTYPGTTGSVELNFNLNPEKNELYYKITCFTYGNGKLLSVNHKKDLINTNTTKNFFWNLNPIISASYNPVLLIVKAYPYSLSDFSPYPYYLRSLALPGWGSNHLKASKLNTFIAIGAYSLLAAGAGLYIKSKIDYKSYKENYNYSESEKLYSKSLSELRVSNILFIGSGVLLVSELARVGIGLQKYKVKNHLVKNGRNYIILNQNNKIAVAATKIWMNE